MARDAGTGRTRCGPALREAGDAPQALPPVASKHLLAAWDLASDAARVALPGVARGFRFENPEAVCLDLLIADPDAACWIAGIEDRLDLGTRYGLSVCLRLLALVQLLARRD